MSVDHSVYYQHSGKLPIASRISYAVRQAIFERFMMVMQPNESLRILDIGVTSDSTFREFNFFEKLYPYPEQITCVGTEDGTHLESEYPGLHFERVTAGHSLPFQAHEFDIAFSNAVIEHVGDTLAQKRFAAEACRVAKRVFITTPNRWFPIEHHTGVPLLHFLPKPWYRQILAQTSLRYWAHENNLNHLTLHEFKQCFSNREDIRVERIGVGWGLMLSNLIAYTIEMQKTL